VFSADAGQKIMKEPEFIAPQNERNDQGDQHEYLDIFEDRSNLAHSDFFHVNSMKGSSFKEMIKASKVKYKQLPPYMKSLASWEV
jgi:hypothetical protein